MSHSFWGDLYDSSPRAGTAILRYGEMRSWEVQGDGRYGDGNSSLGKDGELWRHWGPSQPTSPQPDTLLQVQSTHRGAPHCHINAFVALPTKDCPNHHPFPCLCVHLCAPVCTLETASLNSHLGDPNSSPLSAQFRPKVLTF